MKTCSKCKEIKELSDFNKKKITKDGLCNHCRDCDKKMCAEYHKANPEKVKQARAERYINNKDEFKKINSDNYQKNRDVRVEKAKAYRDANPGLNAEICRKNRAKNLPERRRKSNEAHKRRMKNDPFFAFKQNVRSCIGVAYRRCGFKKNSKTSDILCCSFDEFYIHMILSALRNYGIWLECEKYEIDHIIPMATAKTEEDVIRLNHYTNLQLLYPSHNRKKKTKLDWVIPRGAP